MKASLDHLPTAALRGILRQHGVRVGYVFGSHARGSHTRHSDLDIAVLMPETWDAHDSFTLAATIAAEIAPLVHGAVDLLVLNDAGALARFEAACRGVPILVEDEEERIRFEMRIRGELEDYRHYQSFFVDALKQRLAGGD